MRRRWTISLVAAATLGAAASFAAIKTDRQGERESGASTPSAAQARALGARWRASKGDRDARDYAQALAAAGLYDELLTAISEQGLFARDTIAGDLYRSEATLRQGRYADALEAAAGDNPYLAFARARAVYALTADTRAVAADLQSALRGPKELASEAWLFRARLALDSNDRSAAEAAAHRAEEAGADARRTEAVLIESMIRAGELEAAGDRLARRAKSQRRSVPNPDDFRLAAMIKLKSGDARSASRLADQALTSPTWDARLLAALAKWMSGDPAQAHALVTAELAAAPGNWMALDLAAALARDLGQAEDADALLSRLAGERPSLAALRRLRAAPADEAFEAAATLGGELNGVSAALLGDDAHLPASLAEPSLSERRIAALAVAMRGHDLRAIRAAAADVKEGGDSPVALALSADALLRASDVRAAKSAYRRAASLDPRFFAPVDRLAQLYREEADFGRGIEIVSAFLKHNSGHPPALIVLAGLFAPSGEGREAADIYASLPPDVVFAEPDSAVLYAMTATAVGPVARRRMLKVAAAAPTDLILGQVLAAAGEDERASQAFRDALIAAPWSVEIADHYLDAMTKLGRAEEGNSLLKEIASRESGNGSPLALRNNTEPAGVTSF